MAKFQLDPAGPPVARAPPPPPPAAAPPPPPPPPRAPRAGRGRLVALLLAALVLGGGGAVVGAMVALDLGPFAYPERYLLQEGEVPSGLRLQALPPPIRAEFGITENPDRVPDEKVREFADGDHEPAREAWVQSVGTGRPGEQVVIVAARYASEAAARDAVASDCDGASGVTLRDGTVVVVLLAFTEGGAARMPLVEQALRAKATGLSVACRG